MGALYYALKRHIWDRQTIIHCTDFETEKTVIDFMQNQKMENVLNLALGATPQELERSETLAVGFDPEENTWEVIVKHSRPLEGLEDMGVKQVELLNQYSILTVPESKLEEVSRLPQVEYMEKPKRLYFSVGLAKTASCITYVQVEGSS